MTLKFWKTLGLVSHNELAILGLQEFKNIMDISVTFKYTSINIFLQVFKIEIYKKSNCF